jgi:PAS domain S-box-containing protein
MGYSLQPLQTTYCCILRGIDFRRLQQPRSRATDVRPVATAALSVSTAIVLWPLIPKLLALPSPQRLELLNATLALKILDHQHAASLLQKSEAAERAANFELERRAAEQTAELEEANARLTSALAQRLDALQALARSEEAFRASFEGAVVGKAQVDPGSARILRANPAFARMLGYQVQDLLDHDVWEFTWPEDRAADIAEFSRLLSGEIDVYVGEKRYLRCNGDPLWGRMSGTIVRVSRDRTTHVDGHGDRGHRRKVQGPGRVASGEK